MPMINPCFYMMTTICKLEAARKSIAFARSKVKRPKPVIGHWGRQTMKSTAVILELTYDCDFLGTWAGLIPSM